jgi:trk system potassium uptake protein TrkH
MMLAGVNFTLHFRLLRGQVVSVWKDTELRVYLGIIAFATLLVTLATWSGASENAVYSSFGEALRYGAFQVVSILSTTGFGTADYEVWPPLAVGVLFLLFLVGGMAGSTAGGVKIIRHVLLCKNSFKEIKQLIHPNAVVHVRLNERVVSQDILRNVLSFFVLYIVLIGGGTLMMTALDLDLLSAFGVTLSSVGNIGPAFGDFGPTESYATISPLGKWVLSLLMMAGRLEIFTVLILFSSSFWKR